MKHYSERYVFSINSIGFLLVSILSILSMNTYGQYQVNTEITNSTFSSTILFIPIVLLALPPLIGNPFSLLKLKEADQRLRLSRLTLALSIACSFLIFLVIALIPVSFNPYVYNSSGHQVSLEKIFIGPALLTVMLFISSSYFYLKSWNGKESAKQLYFRSIQMEPGHFRYLVINEIGFLILWIFFLVLMSSHYGDYTVFHGTKPYTMETAGTVFYNIPTNLWDCADLPLIGAPLLTFALRKKEETESAYRFTSYISFGVSLGMLVYLVFSLLYYDHTFYQYTNSYQAVTSASGNSLSFVPFLIFPIILVAALLILAGLQLHEIHQWQKTVPKGKPRI